jgi:hypothetical protein
MPKRIQRKRTKGWTMPLGAVYVGRPTKWGNPFRGPRASAVAAYRQWITGPAPIATRLRRDARIELRGAPLCCWCPLDQPCHADVLLEVANA